MEVDAEAAARAWIEGWKRAWPAKDAETLAAMYTDDALYLFHPFRDPHRGKAGVIEYAEATFADGDLVRAGSGSRSRPATAPPSSTGRSSPQTAES